MKIKQLHMLIFGIFLNQSALASPAPLNTATITTDTLQAVPHCLHFRLRGFCTWFSPVDGINTTPYVEFYSPDLVATVFNKPGDNSWQEMKESIDVAGNEAEQKVVSTLTGMEAGQGQHSFSNKHEQNVFFKEADIVGNPTLPFFHEILSSTATPLEPYFQSMVDAAAWHGVPQFKTPLAEEAYALVADVRHHIGNGITIDWGGIYPHEGTIATNNDAKAAAVISQRAADLTTNYFAGHIVQPLSTQCGQECTAAPIKENSDQTQFQMIYPKVDSDCDYFGKTISYGEDVETQTEGSYAWVIWRFYSGCPDGDGKFVSKTIIN